MNTGIICIFSQSLTHQNTILSNKFHKAHDNNNTNDQYGISFLLYAIKQNTIATIDTTIKIRIGKGIHHAHAVLNTPEINTLLAFINIAFEILSIANNDTTKTISDQNLGKYFMLQNHNLNYILHPSL